MNKKNIKFVFLIFIFFAFHIKGIHACCCCCCGERCDICDERLTYIGTAPRARIIEHCNTQIDLSCKGSQHLVRRAYYFAEDHYEKVTTPLIVWIVNRCLNLLWPLK